MSDAQARQVTNWQLGGLLAGLAAVIGGAQLVSHAQAVVVLPAVQQWNQDLKVFVAQPENTLIGLALVLAGVIVWAASWPRDFLPQPVQFAGAWLDSRALPWRTLGVSVAVFAGLMVLLRTAGTSAAYWLGWFGVVVVLTRAIWAADVAGGRDLRIGIGRADWAWMLGLVLLGAVVLTAYIELLPMQMVRDEVPFAINAWKVVELEPPSWAAVYDIGIDDHLKPTLWVQALLTHALGHSVWGWRMASVLPALASLVPLYLLALTLFDDRRVAIASTVVMIFLPLFMLVARLGYIVSQALPLMAGMLWLWVLGLKRGSYFYGLLAGLVAGLGAYFYKSAEFTTGVVALAGVLALALRKIRLQQFLVMGGLAALGWAMVSLPQQVWFTWRFGGAFVSDRYGVGSMLNIAYGEMFFDRAELLKYYPEVNTGRRAYIFWNPEIAALLTVRGIVWTMVGFLRETSIHAEKLLYTGVGGHGIGVAVSLLGVSLSVRQARRWQGLWLLLWLLGGMFLLSAIQAEPPRPIRQTGILPALALMGGLALVTLTDVLDAVLRANVPEYVRLRQRGPALVLVALLSFAAATGAQGYFGGAGRETPLFISYVELFASVQSPEPVDLVHVSDAPTSDYMQLERESRLINGEMTFETLSDVAESPARVLGYDNPMVVIADPTGKDLAEQVSATLGADYRVYGAARDNGVPLGWVVTDVPVLLDPDPSLLSGIRSAVTGKAWPLVAVLALATAAASWWSQRAAGRPAPDTATVKTRGDKALRQPGPRALLSQRAYAVARNAFRFELDGLVLRCADVETTAAFYCSTFGCRREASEGPAKRLVLDGMTLVLMPADEVPSYAEAHPTLRLQAPDRQEVVARLNAQGVEFGEAAFPDGRVIVVRDPDGLVIEVWLPGDGADEGG